MKRPLKIVRGAIAGLFIMVVAIVSSARSSDGAAEWRRFVTEWRSGE